MTIQLKIGASAMLTVACMACAFMPFLAHAQSVESAVPPVVLLVAEPDAGPVSVVVAPTPMVPVLVVASPAAPAVVVTTAAIRVTPERADDVALLAYSDANSVGNNIGLNVERLLNVRLANGDVEWSIHDASDRTIPMVRIRGNIYPPRVAGNEGARYSLVFRNKSTKSYEVVTTVDGRDTISGKPGSFNQRGYVLMPLTTLVVRGFGVPENSSKPFQFSALPMRLAEQLPTGDVQNNGVLGVALFGVTLPVPAPFPGDVPSAVLYVAPSSTPFSLN